MPNKNLLSSSKRDIFVTLKQFILLPFILLFVSFVLNAQDKTSRKENFDGGWLFSLHDQEASHANHKDDNWQKIDLPHDWSIQGEVDAKQPMGNDGGYYPAGTGWYRKTFRLANNQKGKKISIYFEGVYMNSEVFINGKSLGVRPYGYSSFAYDLSPYLHPEKDNVIAVKVDNSQQKNSRWYSGSGIYRHVWLISTADVHLKQWGVVVRTPKVDNSSATVAVSSNIKNETNRAKKVQLITKIIDAKNKEVGKHVTEVEIPSNSEQTVDQSILVQKPNLWSVDQPNMYKAKVTIVDRKEHIDELSTPFGIRTIAYDAKKGFLLNGQMLKINGGCVHHDNGPLGAAAYDRAEYRKAELLKDAGFNAVRTAHNPPSEAFLDACDQIGLLVMDEIFDGWREKKTTYDYAMVFDTWWQKDLDAMILRDRNHPSIVFWSTGNEIIERKSKEAVETADKLAKRVRELDPTRPVTSAITTWDADWEIFDPLFAVHDIGGYNYQMHHAKNDHARVPSRVIVQTESYPRDAFANWKAVQENDYIIGDFVWTSMDYLGESGIGRYFYKGETEGQHYERDIYPWHGAYCGDIDLIGWRKPISHYRDLLYNDNKKLYMAVKEPSGYFGEIKETMWSVWPTWESWNWPKHEGKDIEIEVYSRYSKVRLYLNEKIIGEKEVSAAQEFKAVFTIPYAAGTLRAVGIENQKEVESTVLQTAGEAAKIKLVPDRTVLTADGQDLAFVTVSITDQNGNLDPNASSDLTFNIEGEGTIVATGSADLQDTERYTSTYRKAWKGQAIVIVKTTKKGGKIRLRAESPNLPIADIILRSQQKK